MGHVEINTEEDVVIRTWTPKDGKTETEVENIKNMKGKVYRGKKHNTEECGERNYMLPPQIGKRPKKRYEQTVVKLAASEKLKISIEISSDGFSRHITDNCKDTELVKFSKHLMTTKTSEKS